MFKEIKNVRQNDGEPFRRIFNSEKFYLIIWFNKELDEVSGFQLLFEYDDEKRSIAWQEESSLSFNIVDDGERGPQRHKMAPIMISTDMDINECIINELKKECKNMEFYIVDKIIGEILRDLGVEG